MLLLLWLKRRDTAPGTILCPLEACWAHQKYNEQTLKKKIPGQNKFRSQVCQLQVKGIWQAKSAMDANQATKHMLLQKANVNLQGCSTLQEINLEQVSQEDHFHLYSCISQDLFSQVNTHQQGLKSRARAAICCLTANAAEQERSQVTLLKRACQSPVWVLNLTPRERRQRKLPRALFAKAMRLERFLLTTPSGLKQSELLFPSCLPSTKGTELLCIKSTFPNKSTQETIASAATQPRFIKIYKEKFQPAQSGQI